MSDWGDTRDGARSALKAAGLATARALLKAGSAVGRAVKAGVDSVDPDVWTHAADLPLVALTMLARTKRAVDDMPDDGRVPVLFVHGLAGHPGNFLPMRTYFRAMGRPRTHAVALPGDCSVEVLGTVLADTVEAAAARAPNAEVDVVAHSLGGLVARAALLELERRGSAARVRTLVTLGTPHAGSHLARYANTVTTRDLRPGSPLLERLGAQLPWRGPPAQPRLIAFWSKADVLVLPVEAATVEGADNRELPGLSHNGLLLSPSAWEAVLQALADAAPPSRAP
ncbi:MAG: alpha/beta fold hydrolase [Myxococcota bacterium]